jgi:hypothetical protein
MAFILTYSDQQIAESCILRLYGKEDRPKNETKDDLAAFRRSAVHACTGTPIKFQFPPQVTSDSKSMNWESKANATLPPIAYVKSIDARKISLSWTYIVTDPLGTGQWDVEAVSREVKKMRGYINSGANADSTNVVVKNLKNQDFIIFFKYGLFGGTDAAYDGASSPCYTFYCSAVDVKHSGPMIYEGNADKVFPLRSDISLTLIEWTSGRTKDTLNVSANIPLLVKYPTPGWY